MTVSKSTKVGTKVIHDETGVQLVYLGTNVDGRIFAASVDPKNDLPIVCHGQAEDFTEIAGQVSENFAERVRQFMLVSGQTSGRLNIKQVGLYIGLICEEFGETIGTIADGAVGRQDSLRLKSLESLLKQFSIEFRAGHHNGAIMRCEHVELLDDMIDTAVVAHGGVASLSIDPAGAEAAVLAANEAKAPGGVVAKTPDGKWIKPAGWKPADLTPFIAEIDRD